MYRLRLIGMDRYNSFRALTRPLAIAGVLCIVIQGLGLADTPPVSPAAETPSLTSDQLDSMVAPVALYPDPLISQILVASTYPLELVQANQFLQQHPDLKDQALIQAAQQQNWDPSVQALIAFPDVLKRLNQDITWTTSLGNTFLARQADVMDAVQRMRRKAEDSGKLASTTQQKVENKTENGQTTVQITPANPDVIYVPTYDPAWIWGPSADYYYPAWYYPPAPPFGVWCYWDSPIWFANFFIGWGGWGGWGWHPHWYSHEVTINDTFIHRYNFNAARVNVAGGRSVWVHDPMHRMGVAYPDRHLQEAYRAPLRPRLSVNQVQQQFRAAAARAPIGGDRIGSRSIGSGAYNRNRTAFGGIENGARAQAHSDRGYSSLNRASAQGGGSWRSGGSSHSGSVGGGAGGGSWSSGGSSHSGGVGGGGGGWSGGHGGGGGGHR